MNTKQLNANVPEEVKATLKTVSQQTGIKLEELVLDAVKLLAGEADKGTDTRVKLFRDTCRRLHLHVVSEHHNEELAHAA